MLDKIYNNKKNNHKTIIIFSFIISFLICFIVLYLILHIKSIDKKEIEEFIKSFISNLITFISICFGFYLTSLSILFSSNYIKTLYIEDPKKPTQRKIHTVKEYFKLAIYCSLFTIGISFIVLLLWFIFQNEYILIFSFSILIGIFIENFLFIYLLLKIFMDAFITQAKPDE